MVGKEAERSEAEGIALVTYAFTRRSLNAETQRRRDQPRRGRGCEAVTLGPGAEDPWRPLRLIASALRMPLVNDYASRTVLESRFRLRVDRSARGAKWL